MWGGGDASVSDMKGSRAVRELGLCMFVQAEDGMRDLVRSRGLGDVYKRQGAGRRPLRDPRGWLRAADDLVLRRLRDREDVEALSLIHI